MVGGGPVRKTERSPLLLNAGAEENQPERLPLWKLILLSFSLLGVQFGWSIQISKASPYFTDVLGIPSAMVNFIWIAGPISGLVVQPVVGVLSDRSESRFGRRRPFMVGGTLFIVLGMMLICNGVDIGDRLGSRTAGLVVAIVGFWIFDLANNAVQGPCRALLVDIAPSEQQNLGGSLFSFMQGLGNIAGYLLGSVNLQDYQPLTVFGTQVRALFVICAVFLSVCMIACVLVTKESPYQPTAQERLHRTNPFWEIVGGIRRMPKPLVRLCIVQFLSWIGWFCFLIYAVMWMAVDIYGGSADQDSRTEEQKKLFEDGSNFGSLALMASSVVTMGFSVVLPFLARWPGLKPTYFMSQLVMAVCFGSAVFIGSRWVAFLMIATSGIAWATTMVYPYTIVERSVGEAQAGLYMGVMNIFIVLPQLLVALTIGFLVKYVSHGFSWALFVGGCSGLAGMIATLFLSVGTHRPALRDSFAPDLQQPVA